MTRIYIQVKDKDKTIYHYYTSGYQLELVVKTLEAFDGDLGILYEYGPIPSGLGNPDHYIDIDIEKRTLKAYDARRYWKKVPDNWKELGYQGIYFHEVKKSRGYYDLRRGKKVTEKNLIVRALLTCCERIYTQEDMETLSSSSILEESTSYRIKELKFDPSKIKTWLYPTEYYKWLYTIKYHDLPKHINEYNLVSSVVKWRLERGK